MFVSGVVVSTSDLRLSVAGSKLENPSYGTAWLFLRYS